VLWRMKGSVITDVNPVPLVFRRDSANLGAAHISTMQKGLLDSMVLLDDYLKQPEDTADKKFLSGLRDEIKLSLKGLNYDVQDNTFSKLLARDGARGAAFHAENISEIGVVLVMPQI
jgi:hypothetical protein